MPSGHAQHAPHNPPFMVYPRHRPRPPSGRGPASKQAVTPPMCRSDLVTNLALAVVLPARGQEIVALRSERGGHRPCAARSLNVQTEPQLSSGAGQSLWLKEELLPSSILLPHCGLRRGACRLGGGGLADWMRFFLPAPSALSPHNLLPFNMWLPLHTCSACTTLQNSASPPPRLGSQCRC